MASGKPTPDHIRQRLRKHFVEGRFSVLTIAKIVGVHHHTAYREWRAWREENESDGDASAVVTT